MKVYFTLLSVKALSGAHSASYSVGTGAFSRLYWPEREANYLTPYNSGDKNACSCVHS